MNVWQKLTLLLTFIALFFFQGVVSKAKTAAAKPAAKGKTHDDDDGDGIPDD